MWCSHSEIVDSIVPLNDEHIQFEHDNRVKISEHES